MGLSKKTRKCPRCASNDVLIQDSFDDGADLYVCVSCDHEFEVYGTRAKQREEDLDINDDVDLDSIEDDWDGLYPA